MNQSVNINSQETSEVDGTTERAKAVALYLFAGGNSDELPVVENEEIMILVNACDEEGWLMAENMNGRRGLVPTSFVQFQDSGKEENTEVVPRLEIPNCPPPDDENDADSSVEESDDSDEDDVDDIPPPGDRYNL